MHVHRLNTTIQKGEIGMTHKERLIAMATKAKREKRCIAWDGPKDIGSKTDRYARQIIAVHFGLPVRKGTFQQARCGTPKCVNPDHFVQHTSSFMSGSLHPRHRSDLTDKDIRAIRNHPRTTKLSDKLARKYGVSPGHIRHIRAGTRWKAGAA